MNLAELPVGAGTAVIDCAMMSTSHRLAPIYKPTLDFYDQYLAPGHRLAAS